LQFPNFRFLAFRICALALTAMPALLVMPPAAQSQSRLDDLRRTLERVDRQLCASLTKRKCRRGPATSAGKPAAPKKATRPADTAATANEDTKAAAKSQAAPLPGAKRPVPVLKPRGLGKKTSEGGNQTVSGTGAAASKPVPAVPVPRVLPPPQSASVANPMPDGTLSGEACLTALRRMKVEFQVAATPVAAGACSVADPVRLNSVAVGNTRVKLPDRPLLTCGFAERFASWLIGKGAPALRSATDSHLLSMGTGPGYQCRGRNGDASAKLSEHAFGNAVDIEYFRLADGQVIWVQEADDANSKYRAVLATLRATGCADFTTVLGPGTNSAHESHFHFDLERRGKKGNHALCQ
jgi:hypothetical protein